MKEIFLLKLGEIVLRVPTSGSLRAACVRMSAAV